MAALELKEPLDCNALLISFDPHFGREALDVMIGRLSKMGLVYFEGF